MARTIGLTLAITAVLIVAFIHAAVEVTLNARPRLERWQARHAGTGLYPR